MSRREWCDVPEERVEFAAHPDNEGRFIVRSPYNESFVDALMALPSESRKWDPDEKVWEVDLDHYYYLVASAGECYPNAKIIEEV